jgi:uncharacterized protein (DUF58 family)
MDTDRFYDASFDTSPLKKRWGWYLLAALLLLLSIIAHQSIAFLAAGFVLVLGLVPELWYRWAFRDLIVRHEISAPRVLFGEEVTLSLCLENRKFLPLPWLELADEIPVQLHLVQGRASPSYKPLRSNLVQAASLWSFQRVTRRYRFRCLQRGRFIFGPTVVRCSDPFGWLVNEVRLQTPASITVYPLLAPLTSFGLPAFHPFGEQTASQRLLEDPLRLAGVRAYQWGAAFRRINWKATARTGQLQSNIYEESRQHRLFVFLDIRTYQESWLGIDPELQELTITAAASIVQWGLDEGYLVGLASNGFPSSMEAQEEMTTSTRLARAPFFLYTRVPMARGHDQHRALLTALGQLGSYASADMMSVIEAERWSLPMGATVLFVSTVAIVQEETIACLSDLQRHGATVHLALTGDPERQPEIDPAALPVYRLGGRKVWHELLTACTTEGQGTDRSTTAFHLA